METKQKELRYQLKQEYEVIYRIEIRDEEFIFRPLTKKEYDELIGVDRHLGEHDTELAEKICKRCVIHPESYDFSHPTYAGVPETVKNAVLEASAFQNEEKIEEMLAYYSELNQEETEYQITNLILAVFPQFTLQDIDNWPMEKIVQYFTRGTWVIQNIKTHLSLPWQQQQQHPQPQGQQQGQQFQQQPNPAQGIDPNEIYQQSGRVNTMGGHR